MLGNVYEWCQDGLHVLRAQQRHIYNDINIIVESIDEIKPSSPSGRGVHVVPAFVRSAFRYWNEPSLRDFNNGFRPSRTYP